MVLRDIVLSSTNESLLDGLDPHSITHVNVPVPWETIGVELSACSVIRKATRMNLLL